MSSRLPCSGNATNQQWRSGGGGRGLSNASKAEAALPAYYRSGARPRASSMVPFAAKPFTEMTSPLQTALQRELQLDVASSGQLLPQSQPVCTQLLIAVASVPYDKGSPIRHLGTYFQLLHLITDTGHCAVGRSSVLFFHDHGAHSC